MAERLLEDFAEIASDWFWEMDQDLRFSYFSARFEEVTGVSPQHALGKGRSEVAANAADYDLWSPHLADLSARRPFRDFVYPFRRADQKKRWFRISGQPHFGSNGEFRGYRGVGTDITVERGAQDSLAEALEELRVQNERFNAALANLPQGLCVFDGDQRLIVSNDRYAEVYKLAFDDVRPGTYLKEILEQRVQANTFAVEASDYVHERLEEVAQKEPSQVINQLADGRAIHIRRQPMADGGWLSTHDDITERLTAEARIAHMAHHDALTDLPNRVRLRGEMIRVLGGARRDRSIAVLCLDLDRFKYVNDTLGHSVGDALLKAVAERLRGCLRETDAVARLGGDEFVVLQVGADLPNGAATLAQRLIAAISAPYDLHGHRVSIGTSVGIAVAGENEADPDQLLKSADLALYRAKADGRGTFRFFETEMDAKVQARRSLELDLRTALEVGQFEVHYQPLIDLASTKICGFEALLRWNHPTRGQVPPDQFIALAEEVGLIGRIGAWVLNQACAAAKTWPAHITVAVNLSPVQFRTRQLVFDVVSALDASGLIPQRLELEITESAMLENTEATMTTLHQLRNLGVQIALDDFGTGFSSLNYLCKFPFDKLKIDRSFVRNLGDEDSSLAIVRALTRLGADMGMATTAEGVETPEQLAEVRAQGCTQAQGYLFSPARSADQVHELIRKIGTALKSAA